MLNQPSGVHKRRSKQQRWWETSEPECTWKVVIKRRWQTEAEYVCICLGKTGLNSSLFGLLWSLCPEPRAPFSFPALMSQRKGPQIGRTSLRFQSPDLQQDILLQDTAVQLPSPWQPCLLTFLFIISSQSWLLSMHQELATSKTQKACTVSPWSQSVCAHQFMFCAWLQRHRCHNRLLTTLVA